MGRRCGIYKPWPTGSCTCTTTPPRWWRDYRHSRMTTSFTPRQGMRTPHAETKYPVLYLLHGWGGDAHEWTSGLQADNILDNLLAQHKIRPMVVVIPLGYGDLRFF